MKRNIHITLVFIFLFFCNSIYAQLGIGSSYIQPQGDRETTLNSGFSLDLNYDLEFDFKYNFQFEVFFRTYGLTATGDTFRGVAFSGLFGPSVSTPSNQFIENYRAYQAGLNTHYQLLDSDLSPFIGAGLFFMFESSDFQPADSNQEMQGNQNSILFGAEPFIGMAYTQEKYRISLKSGYQFMYNSPLLQASQLVTSLNFCYYFNK